MPKEQDQRTRQFGTRVRLFPQAPDLPGYGEPEVVWLSPPAGTVAPGPADDRIYVVDAIDKPRPYEFPYLPPYFGEAFPPADPGADGHFDHFDTGTRHFAAAHLYGGVRRVLDIFESYAGQRLDWHFEPDLRRLEIIPLLDWDNAQSGYGFLEFGFDVGDGGRRRPFALNFDIIAHEVGHAVLFSVIGTPAGPVTPQFMGFHESGADLAALLATLHFDTVLDRLLRATHGNIYTVNELSRLGEISDVRQIRLACNDRTMSNVTPEIHDLSRPLTGAFFDLLAFLYLERLLADGLIGRDVRDAARDGDLTTPRAAFLQRSFDRAYAHRHFQFKSALEAARDTLGLRLLTTWKRLSPEAFCYADVARTFCACDADRTTDDYKREAVDIFRWRQIL